MIRTERNPEQLQNGVVGWYDRSVDSYYYLKREQGVTAFEMYLSTEARQLIQERTGWKNIRNEMEGQIADIVRLPFGHPSSRNHTRQIDPERYTPQRVVHGIALDLQDSLQLPIAIKGTGLQLKPPEREDLLRQYRLMRDLALTADRVFTDRQKEIVSVCPVYGAVRFPTSSPKVFQEWLFMREVVNGRQVPTVLIENPYGPDYRGFSVDDHPALVEFGGGRGDWEDVTEFLSINYGMHATDLAGRNVLWTADKTGKKHYTIIDQK